MKHDSLSALSVKSRERINDNSRHRRGRTGILIKLSRAERRRLECASRKTTDAYLKRRLQTVLLRAKGWDYRRIAEALGCALGTVAYTLSRWAKEDEEGLIDHREDNGNIKVDEDFLGCLEQVLQKGADEHGWQRPTWTREILIQTMKRKTRMAISLTSMSRALKAIGARRGRPRPMVLCPWSKGARTRRIRYIKSLVAGLNPKEVAVYEDEIDIHLNPKIGDDWMLPGQQRILITPGVNQKGYLAGALDAKTRALTWVEGNRKNSALFISLCARLGEVYPKAKVIHMILDNCKTHKSRQTQKALEGFSGRIVLHFLPPYCPDENPIERYWENLHANVTRNHKCKKMCHLMKRVRAYLEKSEHPAAIALRRSVA